MSGRSPAPRANPLDAIFSGGAAQNTSHQTVQQNVNQQQNQTHHHAAPYGFGNQMSAQGGGGGTHAMSYKQEQEKLAQESASRLQRGSANKSRWSDTSAFSGLFSEPAVPKEEPEKQAAPSGQQTAPISSAPGGFGDFGAFGAAAATSPPASTQSVAAASGGGGVGGDLFGMAGNGGGGGGGGALADFGGFSQQSSAVPQQQQQQQPQQQQGFDSFGFGGGLSQAPNVPAVQQPVGAVGAPSSTFSPSASSPAGFAAFGNFESAGGGATAAAPPAALVPTPTVPQAQQPSSASPAFGDFGSFSGGAAAAVTPPSAIGHSPMGAFGGFAGSPAAGPPAGAATAPAGAGPLQADILPQGGASAEPDFNTLSAQLAGGAAEEPAAPATLPELTEPKGPIASFDFLGGISTKNAAVLTSNLQSAAAASSPSKQAAPVPAAENPAEQPSEPEHDSAWYRPDFERADAEALLKSVQESNDPSRGNFVVRRASRKNCLCVSYIASGRGKGEIRHTLIFRQDNGYAVDSNKFEKMQAEPTLEGLLKKEKYLRFPSSLVVAPPAAAAASPAAAAGSRHHEKLPDFSAHATIGDSNSGGASGSSGLTKHDAKSRWSNISQFEGLFASDEPEPKTESDAPAVAPAGDASNTSAVPSMPAAAPVEPTGSDIPFGSFESLSETKPTPAPTSSDMPSGSFGSSNGTAPAAAPAVEFGTFGTAPEQPTSFASFSETTAQATVSAPVTAAPVFDAFGGASEQAPPALSPLEAFAEPGEFNFPAGKPAVGAPVDFGSFPSVQPSESLTESAVASNTNGAVSNTSPPAESAGLSTALAAADASFAADFSSFSGGDSGSKPTEPTPVAQEEKDGGPAQDASSSIHLLEHTFESLCQQERFAEASVCRTHMDRARSLASAREAYAARKREPGGSKSGLFSLRSQIDNLEIQPHGLLSAWSENPSDDQRLQRATEVLTKEPGRVPELPKDTTAGWMLADLSEALAALGVPRKSIAPFEEQFTHANLASLAKTDADTALMAKSEALEFARGVLREQQEATASSANAAGAAAASETVFPLSKTVVESWQRTLEAAVALCGDSREVVAEYVDAVLELDDGVRAEVVRPGVAMIRTHVAALCAAVATALRVRATLKVHEDVALKLASSPMVLLFECDKVDTLLGELRQQWKRLPQLEPCLRQLEAVIRLSDTAAQVPSPVKPCHLCWTETREPMSADDLVENAVYSRVEWSGADYHASCANLFQKHSSGDRQPPHRQPSG